MYSHYTVYIILHSKLLIYNFLIFLISIELALKFNVSVTKMSQLLGAMPLESPRHPNSVYHFQKCSTVPGVTKLAPDIQLYTSANELTKTVNNLYVLYQKHYNIHEPL